MRIAAAIFAAFGLALLAGCTGAGKLIRERAAPEFDCPPEAIEVAPLQFGYRARGCGKEAVYVVQRGKATRDSDIRRATDDPPALPIDRVPGTDSIDIR
ncbi:MAG TPA: hypothetical protein VFP21_01430 [Solirubrobacterales bacterium]|nr:hypothetical protein [Solirubrobacterales bacterium]